MTTIRQAQRAVDKAGIPLEIVRGEGYHYFIYDHFGPDYETVSVYLMHTNSFSAAQWAEEARQVYADILKRLRERGEG